MAPRATAMRAMSKGRSMNELHRVLAGRIARHVRASGLAAGTHLTEASLQARFGISRGPLRKAMAALAEAGVLVHEPFRGYFVAPPEDQPETAADAPEAAGEDALYLALAEDRLTRQLSETVSESELMRRYGVGRPRLRRLLARIAAEGWIERREGRGWRFAALIDSVEAYRESYRLRQLLEPAAMRLEGFRPDPAVLADLRAQQQMVRDGGWQSLGQIELFETNARFHEELAGMSGNRFVRQTIERQNQLRRLAEYRRLLDRAVVRRQNVEHLRILSHLEAGQVAEAADLLELHLGQAGAAKAVPETFSAGPPVAAAG